MVNQHRRGLAWRVALVTTVAIFVILWRSCLGGPESIVQIQFGMDPEALVGAQVLIDGELAGVLERRNAATVNGFPVEEGDHTVELRLPGCDSERVRFTSGFGAGRVTLAWYRDVRIQGTDSVCVLRREH